MDRRAQAALDRARAGPHGVVEHDDLGGARDIGDQAPALDTLFFESGETLHAPHLLDVEVAQVLRRHTLTGAVAPDQGREALGDLMDLPLNRYPHDILVGRVWELRGNLTA